MSNFASLNSHRIRRATLTIPAIGAWQADVDTDDQISDAELASGVDLSAGPISLRGRAIRARAFAGSTRARVVGGAGGWQTLLSAKYYQHDAGVRLSVLLDDVAGDARETLAPFADRVVSTRWTRFVGTGADMLFRLGLKWFVRPDGVTVIGDRAATTISAPFDVIAYESELGLVTVATESIDVWIPGASFSSVRLPATFVARDVVHHIEPTKVRTDVWVS